MGVCCSKRGVVVVKEAPGISATEETLLIKETVGDFSGVKNVNGIESRLNLPNVVESSHDVATQEAETVHSIDQQNNSANRATLIFPTYSGYRSPSSSSPGFGAKNYSTNDAPKAYVSPIQSRATGSPLTNRSALDYLSSRPSPTITRYAPMASPSLQRRSMPSPFQMRSTKLVNTGGDFDSDLESDPEAEEVLINVTSIAKRIEVGDQTPLPTDRNHTKPETTSQSTDMQQVNSKSSNATMTEPLSTTGEKIIPANPSSRRDKVSSTTNTIEVTNDVQTNTETPSYRTPLTTSSDSQTDKTKEDVIQTADACVGTESDVYFRSDVTVQVINKKELKKRRKRITASMAVGTDTSFNDVKSQTFLEPNKTKLPKIIMEHVDEPQTPKPKRRPPPPLATSSGQQTEREIPKPDPIIETLENAFYRFARYGEVNSEGREMNNKNWAKLCRDCDFVDNRNILVGDIDVIFSRHKPKGERLITFDMFLNCLNEIADRKLTKQKKDEKTRREVIYHRVIGKAPELVGITEVSKTGNVGRMTDHHLYPASHKMRFDEEGRGLGIDEKFEMIDAQFGYVNGYKERNQYDQKLAGRPTSSSSSIRPSSNSSKIRPGTSSSQRSQSPR